MQIARVTITAIPVERDDAQVLSDLQSAFFAEEMGMRETLVDQVLTRNGVGRTPVGRMFRELARVFGYDDVDAEDVSSVLKDLRVISPKCRFVRVLRVALDTFLVELAFRNHHEERWGTHALTVFCHDSTCGTRASSGLNNSPIMDYIAILLAAQSRLTCNAYLSRELCFISSILTSNRRDGEMVATVLFSMLEMRSFDASQMDMFLSLCVSWDDFVMTKTFHLKKYVVLAQFEQELNSRSSGSSGSSKRISRASYRIEGVSVSCLVLATDTPRFATDT